MLDVMRLELRSVLLGCLVAGLGCVSSPVEDEFEERPWSEPDQWGSFDVGLRTLDFVDARGKRLVLDVWYPALVGPGDVIAQYEPTILTGQAYRDPPVDLHAGPHPVVAFSHGYLSIRFQSFDMNEYLASHGFVVVAPDHQYNTLLDVDRSKDVQMMLERPDDLRHAVDHLFDLGQSPGVFQGAFREDAYAAVGHSFGSVTVMRLGGGQVDWEGMATACARGDGMGNVCGALESIHSLADGSHGEEDDRVSTVIPMSPGIWYGFGEDGAGLETVRKPFVFGGGLDDILDWEREGEPSYLAMAAPKRLAFFEHAGHYGFSILCDVIPGFKPECGGVEKGFEDLDLIHRLTNTWVTAHLGETMLGDPRYSPWLESSTADEWEQITLHQVRDEMP